VFIVVSIYFVIDSGQKLLDTLLYSSPNIVAGVWSWPLSSI